MTKFILKTDTFLNRKSLFICKSILAFCLVYYLIFSGKLNLELILKSPSQPLFLIYGIFCCGLSILTPIVRWWVLAQIQQLPIKGFDAVRLSMIGFFFNIFIPGGSGGDVVRAAYALQDCPDRKVQAFTIVLFDRGLGLHALLLLGASVILFRPSLLQSSSDIKVWIILIITGLFIGTVIGMMVVYGKTNWLIIKISGKIAGGKEAWSEAMSLYRKFPGKFSLAYMLSIGSAVFNVLAIHFMMLSAGTNPTLIQSIIVGPIIIIANTLPVTPGGIGVAEGASSFLYSTMGILGGANGMASTRVFIVLYALIGLPFYLLHKKKQKIVIEQRQRAYSI